MSGADFRQQEEIEEQEQQEHLEWYLQAKFDEIFGKDKDERSQEIKRS